MYAPDLALVHDEGFSEFSRTAAPWLIARLRADGISDGVVLDLGCGSGVFLRALADHGYTPAGIDASPALVRLARRRAPGVPLRVGSLYRLGFPRCRAVTALSEVLSYLPERAGAAPDYARLFRRVAAALEPGGLFIFDLLERRGPRPFAYRNWTEGPAWTVLVQVTEDLSRNVLRRDIVTFRREGKGWRRSRELHRLHVADREEIRALLREAGFSVKLVRAYGRAELPSRRIGFLARRAA